LINAADFSVAPARALQFANTISDQPDVLKQFETHLWRVFAGELPWSIDSNLLSWLVSRGTTQDVLERRSAIRTWLQEHPDDSNAWEAFLAHLARLPNTAEDSDLVDGLTWVRAHSENKNVIAPLLALLTKRNDPRLSTLLAETLTTTRYDPQFFLVGSAALKSVSSLPCAHVDLMGRWLQWAAVVLDSHAGSNLAQGIATSVPVPARTIRSYLALQECPMSDRTEAEAAFSAVTLARERYYRSMGWGVPPII
jgi:hypothetical protein